MPRSLLILVLGAVALLLVALGAGAFIFERPTTIRVAVSTHDPDDFALMTAAAALLKKERKPIRLHVVPTDNATAASKAVDEGQAEAAVVRSDLALPDAAPTVVILHRDVAILLAPSTSELKEVKDLPGHRIGVVRDGPANDRLLASILAQYEIRPDAVTTVPLSLDEAAEALKSKRVDALLGVEVVSSPMLHDLVSAALAAGDGPPTFIPVAEADAIALRSAVYDKVEIVRGTFGGSPPRPSEEFDTLSVTHRLVASEAVSTDAITSLTRFFLTQRTALASSNPLARRIEAPSTDKGASLPVHEGAAAYIDDEEQTFFDKYSDMIYMGAMLLGVLASGATAVLGRMSARRTAVLDGHVGRLMDMLADARASRSPGELDAIEAEADAILADALQSAGAGADESRLRVLALALDQVRVAIRDGRLPRPSGPSRSAIGPSAAAAE